MKPSKNNLEKYIEYGCSCCSLYPYEEAYMFRRMKQKKKQGHALRCFLQLQPAKEIDLFTTKSIEQHRRLSFDVYTIYVASMVVCHYGN
jgi:hypothetical protein